MSEHETGVMDSTVWEATNVCAAPQTRRTSDCSSELPDVIGVARHPGRQVWEF